MLNRILRRLAGRPDDDLKELARAVRKLTDAQRDHTSALLARLTAVSDLVAQRSTAKDTHEILYALRAATVMIGGSTADGSGERPGDAQLYEALDELARGSRPIVVGPWTGEVGFELLYWVPFVEWFRTRWRVKSDRLVIVSRGGTEAWYGMTGARYADIFSLMTPAAFRQRTDPHAHKQRDVSALDQQIVDDVVARFGLGDAALLHPRLMYGTFTPFWKDEAGMGLIERFTRHRTLAPFDDPVLQGLPAQYVAARFYFSDCFPDTHSNRRLAQRMVEAMSRQVPVVLLNPGLDVDDHADYAPAASPRIVTIAGAVPPERNLAVQTAVIARARAFVGTYGGYAYLAPLAGVPAIGFYSDRVFKTHHLHVAQRVFERLGSATVLAIDTAHAGLVHLATELDAGQGGGGADGQGGEEPGGRGS
jgi:hypothetical protein